MYDANAILATSQQGKLILFPYSNIWEGKTAVEKGVGFAEGHLARIHGTIEIQSGGLLN